jgi:hypothetical protein
MDRRAFGAVLLAAVPLAIVGGLVYASAPKDLNTTAEQSSCCKGYICPATGEQLPCENCCPLSAEK